VINGFEPTLAGQLWTQFYTDNTGQFLRNAAILMNGMLTYYSEKEIVPAVNIALGTLTDNGANVRLMPLVSNTNTIIGTAGDLILANSIPIYGWSDVYPSGASPYWLLVTDMRDRLVWITSGAIDHNSSTLTQQNRISNPDSLFPIRSFDSSDLDLLIGGN